MILILLPPPAKCCNIGLRVIMFSLICIFICCKLRVIFFIEPFVYYSLCFRRSSSLKLAFYWCFPFNFKKKKSLLGLGNGSVETCKHKDMNLIPRTHAHICNVSREAETGFVGWLVCTGQWASGQWEIMSQISWMTPEGVLQIPHARLTHIMYTYCHIHIFKCFINYYKFSLPFLISVS